ncbi:MAG: hypothetical protein B6U88_02730 [Candidatus Aenigmarchaeota archaeon ex4484_56]|nr:MAG: hypothetical protein B6U88_02730 [Candidatus Aenigmarchaeota archaeon ex4484_56]
MVEFETKNVEEIKFGTNNFLEISRKIAKSEDGENEFLQISRGFFGNDGGKRYKKSIAIPDNPDLKEFISKTIQKI